MNASHPNASRRRCLAGAAASALSLLMPASRAQERRREPALPPPNFGRLFPDLPPFAPATPALLIALADIGRPGGLMDAADRLSAGPVALITDPALSAHNPNAALPGGSAGSTFLGQFVDHDVTFDASSRLGVASTPQRTPNARTCALDLDSVYGAGPAADVVLYDSADRAKLKIESGGLFEDLPRLPDGRALIADPRNDEHVIIAGLHAAFILLHNRVVDRVRAAGETDAGQVFVRARRIVTWHYHWIVLHELLPSYIGRAGVDAILASRTRLFRPQPGEAVMPVEFQG